MKYILLCGGIGKRCQYSLPKPLNYVQGKHLIEYIIESIPSDEIYIIYNEALDQYNFRQIVLNKFKLRKFYFSSVSFLTRGAVETALIGMKKLPTEKINNGEPIVFIDNDNIHTFPDLLNDDIKTHFICYGTDYQKTNYSFIKINQHNIIDNIEEKVKISDFFCCGLYGFKHTQSFIEIANELIELNMKTKQEFYFSQLYKLLIQKREPIIPIFVNETKHLGTYQEIEQSPVISNKKMRVCFDLDNTLVTYPETPGDYSTVKPIKKMIDLLHFFRNQGHEIIIYTARRMETHKSNVGKVVKDIAMVTFSTLEKFNIEYDEIIFGKPIADIYIDDRAMNPYYNDISLFGFFGHYKEFIPNKIENNKYNKIEKLENLIKKIGPEKYIRGELFFYQNIPQNLSQYFPKLLDYYQHEKTNEIEINVDFINGIPLYFLYANQTLTTNIIDKCFDFLDKIHNEPFPQITVSDAKIKSNYFDKLKERFENNTTDYSFGNSRQIFDEVIENLEKYYDPKVASIIHGDFWFSNILLNYSNDELVCIDMKGQVYGELTLNGDIYYDYGKMYQSILGYDLILNKQSINEEYLQKNKTYFLKKCQQINLNLDYLHWVTKSLIFGTFYFNSENVCKNEIWDWMNTHL